MVIPKNIFVRVGTNGAKSKYLDHLTGAMYDLVSSVKMSYPSSDVIIRDELRRKDISWCRIGKINELFEWVAQTLGTHLIDDNAWLRERDWT